MSLREPAVHAGTTYTVEALGDAERGRRVRAIMGDKNASVAAFPDGIRRLVFAQHKRHVQPLIEQHWPESLVERAGKKLHFLTCNLYATAPYTVLFSSPKPPVPVALARQLGRLLSLSPSGLGGIAASAVRLTSTILPKGTERKIVLIAAFIATIDHVYDHCAQAVPPEERAKRMHALLDGKWVPEPDIENAGAFRLVRALYEEMSKDIHEPIERRQFERAMAELRSYVDAERNAMTGVVDPSGTCWRMAGVRGTIDGLIFPVYRYCGEPARQWMVDVSVFVQILDDYLDAEKDQYEIRSTPVLTGFWNETSLQLAWTRTLVGLEDLVRASGIDNEHYTTFVRETYRNMAIETAEAMSTGGAA
jgi:hypothetical protein